MFNSKPSPPTATAHAGQAPVCYPASPDPVPMTEERLIGVEKDLRPPLPPNRASGSPAHGSPVSGFLIGIGSLGGLLPW
jgi:hypothetical protein